MSERFLDGSAITRNEQPAINAEHTVVPHLPRGITGESVGLVPFPDVQAKKDNTLVTGWKQRVILRLIRLNILWIACRIYRNPIIAFRKAKQLGALRDQQRNGGKVYKYVRSGNRYFVNFVIPGWPSLAFNRFIKHMFHHLYGSEFTSLSTLIFAITKKCGFRCEHCFEWDNLNKPETLSREDLLLIVNRFYHLGVAQVQLSGGEPLNRLPDVFYLLDKAPKGIDFWLYTTGFTLSAEKAKQLKQHGLTGLTISLDHHDAENHDAFRGVQGSHKKALQAVKFAREAGLAVCFSLCASKEFVSTENLLRYAELARRNGVGFIQLLEPKPVGHYAGKNVTLSVKHQELLTAFFQNYNYNSAFADYPVFNYPGFISRQFGCTGSATHYVYVDTDGDVHNCPFCQQKLFSAFETDLPVFLQKMKTSGCNAFPLHSVKNVAT